MSNSRPLDTMPEFEGLNLMSSALMIEAKAHIAKGEPFDAAVAWIKAGRTFSQLAMELLRAGHAGEAAQDLLNSAHCFLEAGDHRPADQELERFQDNQRLRDALEQDECFAAEHAAVVRWSDQRRRELDRARQELRQQMGHPDAASKLRDSWLDEVLRVMPGVPDFHWFAARKAQHRGRRAQALKQYEQCTILKPENARFWCIRILELGFANYFQDAITVADEALLYHPNDVHVHWFSGWARAWYAIKGRGPRSVLPRACEHFEHVLKVGQLSERHETVVACLLYLCLRRLGEGERAVKLLRETVRTCPVTPEDWPWRMLRSSGPSVVRQFMDEVSELMAREAA